MIVSSVKQINLTHLLGYPKKQNSTQNISYNYCKIINFINNKRFHPCLKEPIFYAKDEFVIHARKITKENIS